MRLLPIPALLALAAACAPEHALDTTHVELPRAEHGRALGPDLPHPLPLVELRADGTAVVGGVVLSPARMEEDQLVLEKELAALAERAPRQPIDPGSSLLLPAPVRIVADGAVPTERVEALMAELCAANVAFQRAWLAVREPGSGTAWLPAWMPIGITCKFSGERIEVRELEGAHGTVSVWWPERIPGTDFTRDRERNVEAVDGVAGLVASLRRAPPEEATVFACAAPGVPWSETVAVLDALAGEGLEAFLSPVGSP